MIEKKEFIEAKGYFFRVSELDTQFYPEIVFENLGEAYFREEKDFIKARKYFVMAIEIFPKAEVWIKAGKCYEKRKEFELACNDY